MSDDRIEIRDLLLRGILGINPEEREKAQDILINLTLFADLGPAGRSDDIADTPNYRTITKRIIEHVERVGRFTVEAMAADIAELCLADSRVERVRVRVEKPGALRFARSVGVEIERRRGDSAV
ncbi:MAG: dihydroneopterin aldolase [Chloroflexi bacterium]|nr:dihydroneopterin aldolase [Chloroflexota bacterium]